MHPVPYLEQLPGQEARYQQSGNVESQARNLSSPASFPVASSDGKMWHSSTSTVRNKGTEVFTEIGSMDELQTTPSCCYNVGEERREYMWDRLVEQRNNGHAEDPELESHEDNVLAFSIGQAGQTLSFTNFEKMVNLTWTRDSSKREDKRD